jgi:triacylglycerol lipase
VTKTLPGAARLFPPNEDGYEYFAHPLGARTGAFDLRTAVWMAEASMLAYSDAIFADATFRKRAGMTSVGAFGQGALRSYSTQCYTAHRDDALVVVFRGTELVGPRDLAAWAPKLQRLLEDVIVDARAKPVRYGGHGAVVHGGFLAALDQVWQPLAAQLRALHGERPARPVWFTGHSLGAALATLAADRYAREVAPPAGVYTFGSPSVGNATLGAEYRAHGIPTFRVVHHHDIVARVPPHLPALLAAAPLPLYEPLGEPHYITRHGADLEATIPTFDLGDWVTAVPGPLEWAQLLGKSWDERLAWLLSRLPTDRLADHAPICYATYLWNLSERA